LPTIRIPAGAIMTSLAALRPEIEARGAQLIQNRHPAAIMEATAILAPPWLLALDPRGELASIVGGVVGTPTLVILNHEGRIHQRLLDELDGDTLLATLDTLN